MDWNALAPMASLMSAGDVLVQYDQAYERYDTPNPQQLAARAGHPRPPGLTDPVSYGTPRPNVPLIPHFDEATLARPPNQGWTAPAGLLHGDRSPAHRPHRVDRHPAGGRRRRHRHRQRRLGGPAGRQPDHPLRRHARHRPGAAEGRPWPARPTWWSPTPTASRATEWNSLNENTGYTETAAQGPDTADPSDAPLDLFPKAPADAQTTAVLHGVSSVTASSLRLLDHLPARGPAGRRPRRQHPDRWLDNSFVPPLGQWWQVVLAQPRTESS